MTKRHILLVDDDEQSVVLTKFILNHAGFVVRIVKNGYDALELVKHFKFDLILLDLNMPMLNGFAFLERFQQMPESRNSLVFVLSVRDDAASITKAKKLGAEDYIIKPPKKEELLKKIENALGGRPQYKEFVLDDESQASPVKIELAGKVVSMSEMGMVIKTPVQFEPHSFLTGFQNSIFTKLKIEAPKLYVCESKKEGELYTTYLSFIDMGESDICKIREWVIEQILKNR